jgi:hypothetical protein
MIFMLLEQKFKESKCCSASYAL